MYYSPTIDSESATSPFGDPLSALGLPPRDTARWTARRKSDVVSAVEAALVSADEACALYGLSLSELHEWRRAAGHCALHIIEPA